LTEERETLSKLPSEHGTERALHDPLKPKHEIDSGVRHGGMSRQREALSKAVASLAHEYPGCGVFLHGSVQRGEERPGSDVDLFAITHEGTAMRFELDRVVDGVRVEVCFWPVVALEAAIAERPFVFGVLWGGEVVEDADGLCHRYGAVVQAFFREHPAVEASWREQLQRISRVKRAGLSDWARASADVRPLGWDELVRKLECVVASRDPA
jgi:Nucleotidyltransferase domain